MSKIALFSLLAAATLLTACQNRPVAYDGFAGYQVESTTGQEAILTYTLGGKKTPDRVEQKLSNACQRVLNSQQKYQVSLISQQEIVAPRKASTDDGVNIGSSNTRFSLSQTQQLGSSNDYATLQGLTAQPRTLQVIRFKCTPSA